jgi:hypothetical protein
MHITTRLCCALAALLVCVTIFSTQTARAQGTWSTIPSMSTVRQIPMGGAINNKFYVVGGYNGATYVNTGEVYNPATNTWTAISNMSVNHSFFASGVIGNKLYVAGGYSGSGNLNTAEVLTTVPSSGDLLISEFRFSGTNTQDEYVELYNNTNSDITVATADGSSGWGLVSNDSGTATLRATITNGTVIPARAHYLLASSPFIGGYQLTGYDVPDKPMVPADISDGGGVALFRTSTAANFTLANRLDAIGFSAVTNSLYREGAGLAPSGGIAPNTSNYCFVRDLSAGHPKDTDDNAADFRLVSTTGAVLGGVQSTLGAPGPESLASPIDRSCSRR